MSTDDPVIPIVFYRDRLDPWPKHPETPWSWSDLRALLSSHSASPCSVEDCRGKDCPNKDHIEGLPHSSWSPVIIPPSKSRGNGSVEAITLLVLDLDHLTDEQLADVRRRLAPFDHIIHSTHCHAPPLDGAYRAIVRLSRPVVAVDWRRFLATAIAHLSVPCDPTCRDLSRLYYLPTARAGSTPFAEIVDGAPLDVDAIMRMAPPEPPPAERRECTRSDERVLENLDAPAAERAIEAIAVNLPERGRHDFALAVAGMLWKHGASVDDAERILFEACRIGGSKDPRARASVVRHTWALPHDARRRGYTFLRETFGAVAADEIGEALEELYPDPFIAQMEKMLADRRAAADATRAPAAHDGAPAGVPVASEPPPISRDLGELRAVLVDVRRRRKRNLEDASLDDVVRWSVLDSIITGEDLIPRGADGAPLTYREREIDADEAVKIAMNVIGFALPIGVPFEAAWLLAHRAIAATLPPAEIAATEEKAEREYERASKRRLASEGQRMAQRAERESEAEKRAVIEMHQLRRGRRR